jgi:MFS family permease
MFGNTARTVEGTIKVEPPVKISGYAWYALALLTIVYVLNFLDRTLIYLLFTPIKADMHLSDTQLALLGATSFAIFYTLLGVPFGRMADRVSRKRLIAAGLAIWSLFSGLTGASALLLRYGSKKLREENKRF